MPLQNLDLIYSISTLINESDQCFPKHGPTPEASTLSGYLLEMQITSPIPPLLNQKL